MAKTNPLVDMWARELNGIAERAITEMWTYGGERAALAMSASAVAGGADPEFVRRVLASLREGTDDQ